MLGYLAFFLELLAVALVIYVLIRYIIFIRNMLMIKSPGSIAATDLKTQIQSREKIET